jgi:uncharacterized peroxidase-related enzyme
MLQFKYNQIIIKQKNMPDLTTPVVKLVSDEEVSGEAKKIFEQMRAKSGKVPTWMRVMANCDDTLAGFSALFSSVMDDAPTDKLLKWKIAYVVSELNKCHYCVSVSTSQLEAMGLDEESLSEIEQVCKTEECIAIEYAKAVTMAAYKVDDALMKKMKEHFTDQQIVEITSVIGLFNYINRFNDALRVFPEVK